MPDFRAVPAALGLVLLALPALAAAPVPDETAALNIAMERCATVSRRYEYRFFDQWKVDLRGGIWFVTATHDRSKYGPFEFDETLGIMIPKDGLPPKPCVVIRPDLPPWRQ
jgi:hypothetical protein